MSAPSSRGSRGPRPGKSHVSCETTPPILRIDAHEAVASLWYVVKVKSEEGNEKPDGCLLEPGCWLGRYRENPRSRPMKRPWPLWMVMRSLSSSLQCDMAQAGGQGSG